VFRFGDRRARDPWESFWIVQGPFLHIQVTVSALVFSLVRSSEISSLAGDAGFSTFRADNLSRALDFVSQQQPDILVLETYGEAEQLAALIRASRRENPAGRIVLFGPQREGLPADPSITHVADSGPAGLEDLQRTLELLGRQVEMQGAGEALRKAPPVLTQLGRLVGSSSQMQHVYKIIGKTANHTYPVLILGESGTGKELVARCIHDIGRKDRPFVPVDCSALTPSLIETELFGHVKGAFTGALNAKQGLLESASGGTVFLDEIGNVPVDLQAKLLRAIQEKEIKPVGSNTRVRTNARIIAATNRDLEAAIRDGSFRQDLFFRLNVVTLRVPPLRDRVEDIPSLVEHFLDKFSREEGGPKKVSQEVMKRFQRYQWPGNVRELENAIERAAALSSGPVLHTEDLPTNLQEYGAVPPPSTNEVLKMDELERRAIFRAIREANGDKLAAAKLLGIGKTTLYRKLREYELNEKTGNGTI